MPLSETMMLKKFQPAGFIALAPSSEEISTTRGRKMRKTMMATLMEEGPCCSINNNNINDRKMTETKSVSGVKSETRRGGTTVAGSEQQPGGRIIQNTYQLQPRLPLCHSIIEKLTYEVLSELLEGVQYAANMAAQLTKDVTSILTDRLKSVIDLKFPRYRVVVQVSVGNTCSHPSISVASLCLWNKETDTYATATYSNSSLYAVALIFAIYLE